MRRHAYYPTRDISGWSQGGKCHFAISSRKDLSCCRIHNLLGLYTHLYTYTIVIVAHKKLTSAKKEWKIKTVRTIKFKLTYCQVYERGTCTSELTIQYVSLVGIYAIFSVHTAHIYIGWYGSMGLYIFLLFFIFSEGHACQQFNERWGTIASLHTILSSI